MFLYWSPIPKKTWKPINASKYGYDVSVHPYSLLMVGVKKLSRLGKGRHCRYLSFWRKINHFRGNQWS